METSALAAALTEIATGLRSEAIAEATKAGGRTSTRAVIALAEAAGACSALAAVLRGES